MTPDKFGMVEVEVDGVVQRRRATMFVDQPGRLPARYKPEVHEGEQLMEYIDGSMCIVTVRNPADVLRAMAREWAHDDPRLSVDEASFDAARDYLDQEVVP